MTGPGKSVLLDTHIYVWSQMESGRLSPDERAAMDNAGRCLVSIVSLWEIALLMNLGRIEMIEGLLELPDGIEALPVTPAHCQALLDLPPIHRDPFDRMLIAQAQVERLTLISRDRIVGQYF